MYPDFTIARDLIPEWKQSLLDGTPPTLYPVGKGGFARVRIGPGLLTLIGGPPGLGKTALVMQWLLDALRIAPELRAVVVNVESAPTMLLDRQLSRLSGIDCGLIRDRKIDSVNREHLDFGFAALDAVAERLSFANAPYTLEHVAAVADAFKPGLIVIDYVQRIPPTANGGADLRQTVAAAMQYLRKFTDAGQAVIVVAAVGRGKAKSGQAAYAGLNLASFRESSELEYGADDAYLLLPAGKEAGEGAMVLHHLKARHGEPQSLALLFDGAHQSFTALDAVEPADEGLTADAISELWRADGDDAGGDA